MSAPTSPIVVADDDPIGRELVARMLRSSGHSVEVAANGVDAWKLIEALEPPLAILDWDMPGLSGLEVLQRAKRARSSAVPYVVLLTANTEVKDRVRGLREGADDYLTKPCDPAELAARVHVGLRVVGLQRSLAARIQQLEDALTRVHNLEQLLPICAHCKRIRSGEGWHELEGFLSSSAGVRFSHGACPHCAEQWMTEGGLKQ
jgi:sigma-B regulation protein RsbU (phosphoserine phosphatase)